MRLDDYDNDINVGEARGGGGGLGGGGGGGGLLLGLLPMIGSRFGCGGVVVVLILLAVFGGLGNLGGMLGGGTGGSSVPQVGSPPSRETIQQVCDASPARRDTCRAFSNAQNTWEKIFASESQSFSPPKLQFFTGSGESGCGSAMSAMGPFYCPTDRGIYLDTSFFDELSSKYKAGGDFAQYYVIAHEFGHHIQNLLGTSSQVQQAQRRAGEAEGNALSVRLELQADCYAGVWASLNRDRLDPGDVEEGMRAAQAIGDDTLQRQAQGRVVPDSFTHGTSAQRQEWLRKGMESNGNPAACDTFSGQI
ncbi:zinc metalloprotease [Sphingomonas sp. Leaf231]|uniref:KPN_02809 family neutral zinc metallopeptidase n=1 Tax=Sphingomonas sp. Leaf231 TaxID=1736301 RepID=UPI0006FA7AC9|nr:neutral zinc metallopeptidase [Sphingomonas sp. Leaf231]KQN94306.1 zinc metalloprotease [Sphingomonas sp. Leaf231]